MEYTTRQAARLRRASDNYIIQCITGWLIGQCVRANPDARLYSGIIRDLLVFGNSVLTNDGIILLPETLTYAVDDYGELVSVIQQSDTSNTTFDAGDVTVYTFRKVGDDPTGVSLLRGALPMVDELETVIKTSRVRFPALANDIFVVTYPVGETSGKDNQHIAQEISAAVKQGASIALPSEYNRADNLPSWKIEQLKPSLESISALANYRDYLIDQLFLAYQVPSKVFREGSSGTYGAVEMYTENALILVDELLALININGDDNIR